MTSYSDTNWADDSSWLEADPYFEADQAENREALKRLMTLSKLEVAVLFKKYNAATEDAKRLARDYSKRDMAEEIADKVADDLFHR